MSEQERKDLAMIRAVLRLAEGSFPGNTDVTIAARSSHVSASITMPAYRLRALLREDTAP